jgi:CRP-like cAMP-binding protein
MKSSVNQRNNKMFETLAQLPLLRGASLASLNEVCGQMKILFSKAPAGANIRNAAEQCNSLIFILSGSVELFRQETNFSIKQTLCAPQVIAPEYLFGLSTSFPCSVTAISEVSFMEISKEDYRRMLTMDPVFLFNYLNMVSARAQRARNGLLAVTAGANAIERITNWIDTVTYPGASNISIACIEREPHQLFGISAAALRSAAQKLGATFENKTLIFPSRPRL